MSEVSVCHSRPCGPRPVRLNVTSLEHADALTALPRIRCRWVPSALRREQSEENCAEPASMACRNVMLRRAEVVRLRLSRDLEAKPAIFDPSAALYAYSQAKPRSAFRN
jgi:hypothetical protein